MLYVDNDNITDPRVNLALEEHLLRNVQSTEPMLLFYINEPSVIIGRNQNTIEEIDPKYVDRRAIHVVRRLSGGGAVYHDLGNLNFSFITPGREDLHNFAQFTSPVIQVLGELGVDAELRGKSDIFAAGKKISGNAQYATAGRMFSHGTLLFDTDIREMLRALNPRLTKIESNAVQSVRNFVTNIRELSPSDMNVAELKQALLRGIFGTDDVPTYQLGDSDWEKIREISANRYGTWEWNYGHSPNFNIQKSNRFSVGVIDARMDVEKGIIQGIRIYGDFTGKRDVIEVEKQLVGTRYDPVALARVVADIDLRLYFGELEKPAFINLLY
ncbi:MAG TPA: lipoate--protein ligase [candidate division Zixibacteria bacterium]|nr:lipoate--protein ligase [candidate division Zixibacteria bacterium]